MLTETFSERKNYYESQDEHLKQHLRCVYLGNPPDYKRMLAMLLLLFCHLFLESDFFAFVSFALTIPS